MADDIVINVGVDGLKELAAQGLLSQKALLLLNKELQNLGDKSVQEDRAVRRVVDALESINIAAAAASGSTEKLSATQKKLNAVLNEAGSIYDASIEGTEQLTSAFKSITSASETITPSIKRQSTALSELIEKQKNFQLLSNTPTEFTQKLSDSNIGARLALQRRINEQGIISPDRVRVIQQEPLNTDAIARIRELNAGLSAQDLLNIRMAFSASTGANNVKNLAEAERILNIANKDVISSEGQLILSTNGRLAGITSQVNKLKELATFQRLANLQPGDIRPDRILVSKEGNIDSSVKALQQIQQLASARNLVSSQGIANIAASVNSLGNLTSAEQRLALVDREVISAEDQLNAAYLRASRGSDIAATSVTRQLTAMERLRTTTGALRIQQLGPLADRPAGLTRAIPSGQSLLGNDLFGRGAIALFGNNPGGLSGISTRQLLAAGLGVQGLVGAISLLKNELRSLSNDAIAFNRSILAIQTISQDAQKSTFEWARELTSLASAFNITQADAAAAAYEIVSQQVGKGAEALRVLGVSAELAQVSQTSATNAAKAITSTINAFGLTSKDADKVAAGLFKTVELGSVRLEELGNSIGRTGTVSRELGISLNESLAAIQAITIQGNNFQDSQTQLLNIQNQLLKPTEALQRLFSELGFTSGQVATQTLGLAGVLKLINERVGTNASKIKELFPDIRALRGGTALVGEGFEKFSESLEKTNAELNGITSTYAKAKALFKENPLEQLTVNFNTFRNDVVEGLTESLTKASKVINAFGASLAAGSTDAAISEIKRGKQLTAIAESQNVIQLQRLAGLKTQLLPAIKELEELTAREQRNNIFAKQLQLKTDQEAIASIKNLTNIRINELERFDRKQQESINKAQDLIDKQKATVEAIKDAQRERTLSESTTEAGRQFRTPSELASLRVANKEFAGLTDAEINAEVNRRATQSARQFAAGTDREELRKQLANPNLFLPDSAGVERARAFFEKIKQLNEENAKEEIDKIHEVRKAEFDARLELLNLVQSKDPEKDKEEIAAAENKLIQAIKVREAEERRVNDALEARKRADKENIEIENQLAELATRRLKDQAKVNEQSAKTKNTKDAFDNLAGLQIFDKTGKFQFGSVEEAQAEIERLLGIVRNSTTDNELRTRAEQIAAILRSQSLVEKPIDETSKRQQILAEAAKSVTEASGSQVIVIESLRQSYAGLHEELRKVIEDYEEISNSEVRNAIKTIRRANIINQLPPGSTVSGFAEGGSVSSRDSIPALLSPGEFVTNPASTSRFFNKLVAMNNGVDPSLPSGSTRFGDINVTVSGVNNANQIADELPAAIKKVLRRGTWRN